MPFFVFITLVSLLKATQYMLRYLFLPTGAIADDELTQARLIADSVPGPLRAKLQQPSIADNNTTATNNAWVALSGDPALSVTATAQGTPPAIGCEYSLTGGPANTHVLELVSSGAGAAVVEIRFNHSINR